MELQVLNQETFPPRWNNKWGKPFIGIYKTGHMSFNKIAAKKLDIMPGDKLSIAQDLENPTDWYIFKDPKGYPVYQWRNEEVLRMSHVLLYKKLIKAFDVPEGSSFRLFLGKASIVNDTKYFGLIYIKNHNK